ncbi:PAS domain S-box protein [Fulvivirga sp. M361]|uniref:PAS domain S-box protein n=1 Tax=Fulvivirga sp. M361 TaxID=2594266 RepID=UPI001179DAAB|nr:PAS domain S-box protein [Fulvivirga sp. M361]TRX47187.1 PAS domain S-box protein [Fulvivirga sp. M361]
MILLDINLFYNTAITQEVLGWSGSDFFKVVCLFGLPFLGSIIEHAPEEISQLKSKLKVLTKELKASKAALTKEVEQRRQTEEELKLINKGLETVVRQRWDDLSKANSKLAQLNEMLESTQNLAGMGTWEIDLLTQDLYWSDKVYEIHGIAPGTKLDTSKGISFFRKDFQPVIQQAVHNAIEKGERYNLELVLVNQKGEEIWVNAIGLPVVENGKTIKLRGLFQDIDDRKKLEFDEKNLKRRLEYYIEHMPAAVAMFDKNMHYLVASKRWYTDYNLEGQDIIGRHHYDIFPEIRQMPHWIDDHQRALAGEVIQNNDDPFVREDGTRQWLKYEIYPWYDETGEIGGIGMFTEDITPEREMMEAIKLNEEKFRSVVEYSAIGMTLVSTEGRFLDVNLALGRILGYSREELMKCTFQEITHPEDLDTDLQNVQDMMDLKIKSYQMEKRYRHKKGKMVWAQLNVSAAYKEDGNVAFFISQIQDITERKKIEKDRRNLEKTLERKVAERTTQLEVANKELQAFSYSVSHDLRTPLRSLSGFSKALIEDYYGDLDATAQNYLNRIAQAANRMGHLIDDLLSLSNVSKREVKRQELNLSKICREVIDLMHPESKFNIYIEPGLEVVGDKRLVKVVMENLLGNAIKYAGKIAKPKIAVKKCTEEGEEWIMVQDNGVGFDMEYAGKLFVAFQRLHAASEFPGTGIGLATVQRIINKHNGKIKVYSAPDQGATFYFNLNNS